jgi:hypothetical protein
MDSVRSSRVGNRVTSGIKRPLSGDSYKPIMVRLMFLRRHPPQPFCSCPGTEISFKVTAWCRGTAGHGSPMSRLNAMISSFWDLKIQDRHSYDVRVWYTSAWASRSREISLYFYLYVSTRGDTVFWITQNRLRASKRTSKFTWTCSEQPVADSCPESA